MIRSRFKRPAHALIALSLLSACDRAGADVTSSGEDAQLPPPAAAISAGGAATLESRLERLESELGVVLEAGLDEESHAWLFAAEAATDRLLEEELGAEWLRTGYLVEARLRQIQALADRIIAELQRGVARELVLEDIASLRLAVRDLRAQLAQPGNGGAPPPLDTLLAATGDERTGLGGVPAATAASSDTSVSSQPAPEPEVQVVPEGGPIGEPIRP